MPKNIEIVDIARHGDVKIYWANKYWIINIMINKYAVSFNNHQLLCNLLIAIDGLNALIHRRLVFRLLYWRILGKWMKWENHKKKQNTNDYTMKYAIFMPIVILSFCCHLTFIVRCHVWFSYAYWNNLMWKRNMWMTRKYAWDFFALSSFVRIFII